jgi:chitodextrinase
MAPVDSDLGIQRVRRALAMMYGARRSPAVIVLAAIGLMASSSYHASAATVITTVAPAADAYVKSSAPGTNYGSSTKLRVDHSPVAKSYLRFTVSGLDGPVVSARLRVYATSNSAVGFSVSSTTRTWRESRIDYANAPAGASKLGTSGRFKSGRWVAIDVSSVVTGDGSYAFVLHSANSTGLSLASREAGAKTAPQLKIVTAADTTPPTAPGQPAISDITVSSGVVTWVASSDAVGVTAYHVYVDGVLAGDTAATWYQLSGFTCDSSHTVAVTASDAAGNVSASASAGFTTAPCLDPSGGPAVPKYRFAYSNRVDQAQMPGLGYNLIDVSTKSEADAIPAGTLAQVWLYDYDNTTCSWEKDDTYITNMVTSMANDPKVAGFYFSNEPDPFACPNAPAEHKARNALIHSLAPTKYTLIGIDANWRAHFDAYGSMWVGAADYINYNPYVCYEWDTSTCDYSWLDHVIATARSLPQPYFIALQAFRETGDWRWPTPQEESTMLSRLTDPGTMGPGFQGYLTFSWNWQSDPLANHPDVLKVISNFNLGRDSVTPDAVTGLATSATFASSVSLAWTAATDNTDVAGYRLFQNGTQLTTTSALDHQFEGLTCGTSYTFGVAAVDTSGNVGPTTSVTAASGSCTTDLQPPTAPSGLASSSVTQSGFTFSWNASSDNVGVLGYNVYRDGARVSSSQTGTSIASSGLVCGTSYTMAVEAIDAAGNTSPRSQLSVVTGTCSGGGGSGPCSSGTSAPATYQHVIWIWFENHSYSSVLGGNSSAPYFNALAGQCGYSTQWMDNLFGYNSEPEYLAGVSGSNCDTGFGSTGTNCNTGNDGDPSASVVLTTQTIFDQVASAGGTWRSYQEGMPANCSFSSGGSGYAAKHNPAVFFATLTGGSHSAPSAGSPCAQNDVPFPGITCPATANADCAPPTGTFLNDIQNDTLPTFSFVTPNLCNDMHDCSPTVSDNWIRTYMTAILQSPAYASGNTAVFLMWDEGSYGSPQPNVVVSPTTSKVVSSATMNNLAALRTTEDLLGLATHLGCASGTAPGGGSCPAGSTLDLRSVFHL